MECSYYLSVETGAEFLRSQQQLLNQSFQGLMIYGRQVDPGVWISRNVALHPTAKITPPVYIGENSRIGRGAQIGPFAVIGPNCIVSDHAIVVNSLVASGTFVGEGLELDSVIVDRNRLLNVRLQTSILTSEAFLLSGLTERTRARGLSRFGSALIAFIFLVFLWPLLLVTLLIVLLTRRGSILPFAAIQIPTDNDPANWRSGTMQHLHVHGSRGKLADFFYRFLPGLLSVLRGDLFLVGVQPRTREQILALSPDWRSLYLGTKAGLITEAAVMFGPDATEDEIYTAEAFYSATESLGHDCRLVGLWFLRLITGPDRSGVDLAEDSDR
jgi:lipopolysaccharide/colanic/teichoic acid biosynthesis glycosyltransferase